jgi:hypothetical protein
MIIDCFFSLRLLWRNIFDYQDHIKALAGAAFLTH